MDHFEKTIGRILPIPSEIYSGKLNSEDIRVEAEKWCKPFACTVQLCSEPRTRNEEEKKKCLEAPGYYKKCVERISEHIEQIVKSKGK